MNTARTLYRATLSTEPAPLEAGSAFRAYLCAVRDAARVSTSRSPAATRRAELAVQRARRAASEHLRAHLFDALSAVALGLRDAGELVASGELAPGEVDAALVDLDGALAMLPVNDTAPR